MTSEQPNYTVYIGTYTRPKGNAEGIYVFRMDPASGALEPAGVVPGVANPSYLALDPAQRTLYAVGEEAGGVLSAFRVEHPSGTLTPLNRQPTHGAGPCYVSVDPSGRWALAANYASGSLAVLLIQPDGSLGPATATVQHEGSSVNPKRQAGPHAHSIIVDAANRHALAADLGMDRILVYDLSQGTLTPNSAWAAKPGAGPRHLAFHPNGRWLYATNELDSTVTALSYDAARGALAEIQTLPMLPAGYAGESWAAHLALSPSGRTLYASNRGHDSLAVYTVDEASGALTPRGHTPTGGQWPRHFALDPAGRILLAANQNSDSVVAFRVDPATGDLTPTGQVTTVPTPVCVQIVGPLG